MNARFIAAAALAFATLVPAAASADPDDRRFFDRPHAEHEITGRVEWSRPFRLELEGARHVRLHDGTVINPRGLTLHHGMLVRVVGHEGMHDTFVADEVDLIPHGFDRR